MKINSLHTAPSSPVGVHRRCAELSHGAMTLDLIRRELSEVRRCLEAAEDETLRARERELVLLEEKYRVYGRKYRRFYKKV